MSFHNFTFFAVRIIIRNMHVVVDTYYAFCIISQFIWPVKVHIEELLQLTHTSPAKEPPSQYIRNAAFQLQKSGFTVELSEQKPKSSYDSGHWVEEPNIVVVRLQQSALLVHQPPPIRCSIHLLAPVPVPGRKKQPGGEPSRHMAPYVHRSDGQRKSGLATYSYNINDLL